MLIFGLHICIFLLTGFVDCIFVTPQPQVLICQVGELQVSFFILPPWRIYSGVILHTLRNFFFFCGWCLQLMVNVWWVVYGVDI